MRTTDTHETDLVVAAQAGDQRALDELVATHLPLVYTLVRRALSGDADVDDVVQETMLRALRELPMLRMPDSFRPWLVAIAMRQVSTHLRRRSAATDRTTPLDELPGGTDPEAEFEGLTLLRLEVSEQRRQVARASRWLDPDDRALLSLWWLEVAGELSRTELAAAMGMGTAHAAVRVQRMRNQLQLSRSVVAALDGRPGCSRLESVVAEWDGVPNPLWRKRVSRHTRSCAVCRRAAKGMIEPERLLLGFALLPVPASLAAAVTAEATATSPGATAARVASGALSATAKAGALGKLTHAVGAHPGVAAAVAGTLLAGAGVAALAWSTTPAVDPAVSGAQTPASAVAGPFGPAPSTSPAPGRSPAASPPEGAGGPRLALGPASLESVDEAGFVVATVDDQGILERIDAGSAGPDRQRATFEVVRGLADPKCISFRARDGRYLRHSSWRLRLHRYDGTSLFRGDATFCVRAGSVPGSVALESANYPGGFLRHENNELWVNPPSATATVRADASFRPGPPLAD
jgi:RNA polymerase sigma factor (sigma-70 family)